MGWQILLDQTVGFFSSAM